MIEDDTRQTIKFVAWLIGIIIFLYAAAVLIFYKASNPERNETKQLNQIALAKSPITKIEKNYHLDRGVNSYSLKGSSKNHQQYYFIYLPGSKKGYLLSAKKGVGEAKVRSSYQAQNPNNKITKVNLGWYNNRAVWEVTAKDSSDHYQYQLYEFKNGNLLG